MKAYLTNPNLKRARRTRQHQKQRQRLTAKQIFIGTSSILAAAITGLLIYFQIGSSESAKAAFIDDYRTVSSGNWQTPRTWEKFNGSEWVVSNTTPSSASNTIEIRAGHTIVVNTKITADQVIVDESGKIITESGSLKIVNGQGTDLTVRGALEINGSVEIAKEASAEITNCTLSQKGKFDLQGTLTIDGLFVNNGGKLQVDGNRITIKDQATYEHAFDGGCLPLVKWEKNSNCEITGMSTTIPENMNQAFGNLKWRSTSQLIPVDLTGIINNLQNDLYISSTGMRDVYLSKSGTEQKIQIKGSLFLQGGSLCINPTSSSDLKIQGNVIVSSGYLSFNGKTSTVNSTITIGGELNIIGGTVDLNSSTSSGKGSLNLFGNISVNGNGLLTETSNNKGGEINFIGKNKVQLIVVNNNIKNNVDYNVMSGSVLRMDNYILTGNGYFNVSEGAGLMIGSPLGITKSEMSGNIQTKGSRYYSTRASYTYNGGSEQQTGDGLPSLVYALTVDNEANCNLQKTTSASNLLNLEVGKIITGKNMLILGVSENNIGVLKKSHGYVQGNLRRWVNSNTIGKLEFPVGNSNSENSAILNFTKSPKNSGTITCSLGIGNVNKMGLPLSDGGDVCMNAGYAYWNISSDNGYAEGVFDLSLAATGFPGIQNYEKLHISQRNNLQTPWKPVGKHEQPKGTNENAIVTRKDVTELGIFGITSGPGNSLPTDMVYFTAHAKNQQVELNWKMACEVNNDYFSVERSDNGSEFTSISTIKGAGSTTEIQSYQYHDYKPLTGTSFYRLRQVNFEGKNTFSNIERINVKSREGMASSINIQRVGPNPFNSMVTAEFYAENNGDVAIEILTTSGKTIFKTYQYALKGYNTFTYNKGSSLESGEYMIRLSNSNGAARKFITKRD